EAREEMDPVQVATLVIRDGQWGEGTNDAVGNRDRHEDARTALSDGADHCAVEFRWRYADDGQRHIVDEERAPEDVRVASECALPVRVAQHDRFRSSVDSIILRAEHPAERGLKAEHREI